MTENKVELSAEEAYELLKIKAVEEVHSEVLAKLKRKLWVFGVVIAVVGFFGINGLVTMTIYGLHKDDLRSAQKASITAEEASITAEDTTLAAQSAIDSVTKLVSDLEKNEQAVNRRLDDVLTKAEGRAENVRASGLQEVSVVSTRLDRLAALVESLAKEQPNLVSEYQSEISVIDSKASVDSCLLYTSPSPRDRG